MKTSLLSRYLLTSVLCMAAGAATAADTARKFGKPVPHNPNFDVAPEAGFKVPQRLKGPQKDMLLHIADTDPAVGVMLDSTTDDYKTFLKSGWLLTDKGRSQGNQIPVILSNQGWDKVETYRKTSTAANPRGPQPKPDDFVLEDDVPMPDFQAGRRQARQVYPFETMRVGQSFFIATPAEYKGDDFAASKSGTIGAQNRKAKEAWAAIPDGTEGKPEAAPTWRIVKDNKGDVAGARVFRVS